MNLYHFSIFKEKEKNLKPVDLLFPTTIFGQRESSGLM